MSLLVICEILGHFVITLTANGKYSLNYRKNLPQVLQMQLSKKQTFFSDFVAVFLRSKSNFENFEKYMSLMGHVLPIFPTTEDVVR